MSSSFLPLLFLVIVSAVYAGQKVCPGYGYIRPPKNCNSTCSVENDQCASGTKCCFQISEPCGFQCIVAKDNERKSGQCPSQSSEVKTPLWGICDAHFCDVDSDCQGAEKCCPNPCGAPVCVAPQ